LTYLQNTLYSLAVISFLKTKFLYKLKLLVLKELLVIDKLSTAVGYNKHKTIYENNVYFVQIIRDAEG